MQLIAKRVTTLVKRPGRYHDGHGLILVVVTPNNASWQLRYQRNGRERWLGLGPLHTVTLKDARERARAARLQLLDGIDPIDARRTERAKATQVMTFKAAAEAYSALHEQKWRNAKHRKQFLASLACYAYPVLGDMTVSAIDTAAVLRVVEPIWLSKTETANRVRGRIESVLDWATVRGHRSGGNPARWKGHLAGVLPAPGAVARRSHHPALPWAQVAAFMIELRMRKDVAARALEFTILTAARTIHVFCSPANASRCVQEIRSASTRGVDLTSAFIRTTGRHPANGRTRRRYRNERERPSHSCDDPQSAPTGLRKEDSRDASVCAHLPRRVCCGRY